jgi:hypothetical protein
VELVRCDRKGCEQEVQGTRAEVDWYGLAGPSGVLDFCSWRCINLYASPKALEEADRKEDEKARARGDEPARRAK